MQTSTRIFSAIYKNNKHLLSMATNIYTSPGIEEQISNINTTEKGGSYVNAEDEEVSLADSKDVTRRKKEIRVGTGFIARTERNQANVLLSQAVTSGNDVSLKADDLKGIAVGLSSHISSYTTAITGSKKYGEMVSTYLQAVMIRTFLLYSKEGITPPKAKAKASTKKPQK